MREKHSAVMSSVVIFLSSILLANLAFHIVLYHECATKHHYPPNLALDHLSVPNQVRVDSAHEKMDIATEDKGEQVSWSTAGFQSTKDGHGKDALFTDFEFDAVDSLDVDPLFDGGEWLSEQSIRRVDEYATQYQSAPLFPHIAIDGFFTEHAAKRLLQDFPNFKDGNWLNEYGRPGRKSVNTNIRSVSPHYAKLWKYIGSESFLSYISTVTGIPDLLMDPTMFGGGTHENLNGQNLNTHVDFNYNRELRWHRRVNILFYLNDGWDCSWGGCITLQSNPWCYDDMSCNTVKQYEISFNRAVIFSTSEKSWHGFRNISAPSSYQGTRKLVSIYLYSRNRPAPEVAGAHGTHYIPTTESTGEIAAFIQQYMKTEVELNRQLSEVKRERQKLWFHRFIAHPPGMDLNVVDCSKFHDDGWIEDGAFMDILVPANVMVAKQFSLEGQLVRNPSPGKEVSVRFAVFVEQGHRVFKVGENSLITGGEGVRLVTSLDFTRVDKTKEFILTIFLRSSLSSDGSDGDDRRRIMLVQEKQIRLVS